MSDMFFNAEFKKNVCFSHYKNLFYVNEIDQNWMTMTYNYNGSH